MDDKDRWDRSIEIDKVRNERRKEIERAYKLIDPVNSQVMLLAVIAGCLTDLAHETQLSRLEKQR
jgi:hypothetical protein